MPNYPISPAELLDLAQASLHYGSAFGAEWTTLADQAIAVAYADLTGALQVKGYTQASVEGWDFLAAFTTQQALWRLSELTTNLTDWKRDPGTQIKDLREYIQSDSFVLIVDGVAVAPVGTGPVGGIGYGSIAGVGCANRDLSLAWYGTLSPYYAGNRPPTRYG